MIIIGRSEIQGQSHTEGQTPKIQSAERQRYITLLLVTFSFLMLVTQSYAVFIYGMFYHNTGYYLFARIVRATYYTNYGINFFLYVISGKKFRADLMKLLRCDQLKTPRPSTLASPVTVSTNVSDEQYV